MAETVVVFRLVEDLLPTFADFDEVNTTRYEDGKKSSSTRLEFAFGVTAQLIDRSKGMLKVSVPDYLADIVEQQVLAAVAFRSEPKGP